MKFSNTEKKFFKEGYKNLVGIDEAGRGPLAGPVIAVAVIPGLNFNSKIRKLKKQLTLDRMRMKPQFQLGLKIFLSDFKDSKKMSVENREAFYRFLFESRIMEWGIGKVSEKIIDKINILQATKLAMARAVKNLERKLFSEGEKFSFDLLIIDGNFGIESDIVQQAIIKGDEKVFLIKTASIIAKVHRDKIMLRYHKRYPQYGFDKHKGYGTALHLKALREYGPCEIHRQTFRPIKR